MTPQLPPYMPTEYLPGSYGRYRQYPRSVRAQIPGTGYDVGRMRWAEQRLNLTGNQRQSYGNYANVPLRGLGDSGDGLGIVYDAGGGIAHAPARLAIPPEMMRTAMRTMAARPMLLTLTLPPPGSGDQGGGDEDVASQIARAAEQAEGEARAAFATNTVEQPVDVPLVEDEGFFAMKVGPVPVWALGLGGIAVVGGGAWFMLRKKKPKRNRRR